MSERLLTPKEYAEHRKQKGLDGGTQPGVVKALRTGRIFFADGHPGLFNPEQADADWAKYTVARPKATSGKSTGSGKPNGEGDDYQAHRAKREYWESELAKLKVEKQKGLLIEASVVRKVLYEAGRIIRAGHEDIVSQLSPDLAPAMTITAVERILKTRLDRLDSDLAEKMENLDESVLKLLEERGEE